MGARRDLALRILKHQGSRFADGSDRKHFCRVTNRKSDGAGLIRWHRGNAGWVRLNSLLDNRLSLAGRIGLPPELHGARPYPA